MSERGKEYHKDVPIVLLRRTPTNSETNTKIITAAPPFERKKKRSEIRKISLHIGKPKQSVEL